MSPARASESFGVRLLRARELRGLNQAEVAARAGLTPSAISHFETGGRKPSFENLRRLADALRVSTDFLLARTDDPGAVGKEVDALLKDLQHATAEDQEFIRSVLQTQKRMRQDKS